MQNIGLVETFIAIDQDLPGGRLDLSVDQLEQCRLARTARPAHEREVALLKLEADIAKSRRSTGELLADTQELDQFVNLFSANLYNRLRGRA